MDRVYRLYLLMHNNKSPWIRRLLHGYLRVVFACDIMPETQIGEGSRFPHNGLGVVIHPDAVIGRNCRISQGVTIGGRGDRGVPQIGDDVLVGAGAIVLGGISVGDRARIGAGSVVLKDVPPDSVVAGNPAKTINRDG